MRVTLVLSTGGDETAETTIEGVDRIEPDTHQMTNTIWFRRDGLEDTHRTPRELALIKIEAETPDEAIESQTIDVPFVDLPSELPIESTEDKSVAKTDGGVDSPFEACHTDLFEPTDLAIVETLERIDNGQSPDVAAFTACERRDTLDSVADVFESVAQTLEAADIDGGDWV